LLKNGEGGVIVKIPFLKDMIKKLTYNENKYFLSPNEKDYFISEEIEWSRLREVMLKKQISLKGYLEENVLSKDKKD